MIIKSDNVMDGAVKTTSIACIIDDDPLYVFSVKGLLANNKGCRNTLIFTNGYEAIKGINSLSPDIFPDLIFLDINMPVMDGWDFLNELDTMDERINKRISVYLITSSSNDQDKDRAKGFSKVSGFVNKPLDQETIDKIVSAH